MRWDETLILTIAFITIYEPFLYVRGTVATSFTHIVSFYPHNNVILSRRKLKPREVTFVLHHKLMSRGIQIGTYVSQILEAPALNHPEKKGEGGGNWLY